MYQNIIFYSASFLLLLFGVLTLFFKNIFYSLLSAICVFFLTAVIFWLLGSEYNAVIQLAIYGFAVPVILGLGIMFTESGKERIVKKRSNLKYALFLTGGLFVLALIYLVLTSLAVIPDGFNTDDFVINNYDNFRIFANGIFVKYVFAFELVSVILTIAAVGLTIMKGGKSNGN